MAEAQKKENKQSVAVLDELMSKLAISKVGDEAKGTAIEIAQFINGDIEEGDAPVKYVTTSPLKCDRMLTISQGRRAAQETVGQP